MNNIILQSMSAEEFKSIIREAIREETSQANEKKLLNFRETCEFLGISPSALNKWKSENKIPFKKLGKRVFFDRQEVLESLKDSNYKRLKELKS